MEIEVIPGDVEPSRGSFACGMGEGFCRSGPSACRSGFIGDCAAVSADAAGCSAEPGRRDQRDRALAGGVGRFSSSLCWIRGLSRRTYCLILTATASISVAIGIATLTPAHLNIAVPALLVATISMVLYTGSSNGWTAQVTGDHERGAVEAGRTLPIWAAVRWAPSSSWAC